MESSISARRSFLPASSEAARAGAGFLLVEALVFCRVRRGLVSASMGLLQFEAQMARCVLQFLELAPGVTFDPGHPVVAIALERFHLVPQDRCRPPHIGDF